MNIYVCDYKGSTTGDKIKAIRALRNALEKLMVDNNTPERASEILEDVIEQGVAFLGSHSDEDYLYEVSASVWADAGAIIETLVDPSDAALENARRLYGPGESQENPVREAMDDEGDDIFSAHRTAMVLLVMTEGNPLRAAAHAVQLGRASNDEEFYGYVVTAMADAFPWVGEVLIANGLAEKEDN
jgi:hypothetical protein